MPPPGYAPCYEALLPRERMRIEPIKEYKHDFNGVRNLLGPTLSLTHTSFTPCPVDTVQVKAKSQQMIFVVIATGEFVSVLVCGVDRVAAPPGAHSGEVGREHS